MSTVIERRSSSSRSFLANSTVDRRWPISAAGMNTSSAGPRESKTRSKLQKNGRMSQVLNLGWTKRIFRFQMLPLDQRNLLIICGQNFIYNNTAGSNCFHGLAHGPALNTSWIFFILYVYLSFPFWVLCVDWFTRNSKGRCVSLYSNEVVCLGHVRWAQ